LLNAEVRCISRVVVDPRWRGLGLAVRLVKAALAEPTTPITEALAAMGRVNPFFERAGMTAYPRPTHAHDARLLAALARSGFGAGDLVQLNRMWRRLEATDTAERAWLLREVHRWYQRHAGRGARPTTDPREQLAVARERLSLEPVYYLKDHRAVSP
jgi:GNAT superfamily N-acetyltransferase